jgi:hypothetical protein
MLRERAADVLRRARFLAQRHDELASLAVILDQEQQRLEEPMRVAVAGLIKRGKSTLVNALLGGNISPTGTEETTFNVVELAYGKTASFDVLYKGGRVEQVCDLGELHHYVARTSNERAALSEITRVCVSYPNELLRDFRLLDVPGLGSVFEEDSVNAMERLGIRPESVTTASLESVDQADAVVYLFNRAMAVSDADIVREFGGAALERLSPVKAIGVLSRVDDYWPPRQGASVSPADYDPLERAVAIADRYLTDTRAADIFYDIKPVIAKMAVGAATATEEDLENVRRLSSIDSDVFFRRVRDTQRFSTKTFDDVPLAPEIRARLVRTFGVYGIYIATQLSRAGASNDEIRSALAVRSGVKAVRDVIVSHFGNRADLIKLAASLGRLEAERAELRPTVSSAAGTTLSEIGRMLGQLRASEHGFRELDALHHHYKLRADRRHGRSRAVLDDDQAAEFLRVTGEHGLTCADRLGCPTASSTADLLEIAAERLACWRQRAVDPTVDRAILPLIEFLTIAYELLWHHVHEAQRHLNFEEDHVVG